MRSRILAGRDPAEVTLVAVSKTHPPEAIRAAMAQGVTAFGENKVQEAESKIEEIGAIVRTSRSPVTATTATTTASVR